MSDAYRARLRVLAFGADADAAVLPGFDVYRDMIRTRLFAMARSAYRRSWALLGGAACDACFARYLEVAPPRSPLLREVIGDFGAFALAQPLAVATPFARDLLRFEAIKWTVADAPTPRLAALAELDFDGAPVLNPTLQVLDLSHAVDLLEGTPVAIPPAALLVFRRADDDDVRWYRVTPLLGDLLAQALRTQLSFGVLLPRVVSAHAVAADAALLNAVAFALTLAVERGVVLGVRAQTPST